MLERSRDFPGFLTLERPLWPGKHNILEQSPGHLETKKKRIEA